MSARETILCADVAEVARRAAEEWIRACRDAVERSGRFTVALSGGNTPRSLYDLLAGAEFRDKIPWDRIHFFWGDERAVPADHPDSNYGMARAALLAKVPARQENIHRVETDRGAVKAAAAYEDTLREVFALGAGAWPSFDLMLLGLGDDGHTASLFPGSAALSEAKRLVVANFVEKLKSERITMTLPVLNRAATVVFLVSGAAKAKAVGDILRARAPLPAAQVDPLGGRLLWILDRDAAAFL
jgi:6-phosphogluconolactonase